MHAHMYLAEKYMFLSTLLSGVRLSGFLSVVVNNNNVANQRHQAAASPNSPTTASAAAEKCVSDSIESSANKVCNHF